ncbi:MAG TPA: sigma-70 family RNA polymerase sigma factor [Terriglobia bacterium]|nr:sigma-70 family RNA polymerase sigma factor [Terriglobia bacterium]
MRPADGDKSTLEGLYRQHGAQLVLFASALTGERSRAQDMVHQVFVKLLERGSLGHAEDAKAYLFTSVRNAVLNDAKVRARHVALDSETAWFDPPDRDYAAERNLRRAMGALSEDQREVVVLHIWGEMTFFQIAQVLGISANTAASRYRYALARLRDVMSAREEPCANA